MTASQAEHTRPQDLPATRTVVVSSIDTKLEKAMELAVVPMNTPALIPRRLFEHVRDREFDTKTIDRIYQSGANMVGTPDCLLYVLVDRTHEIHGFLWMQLDPFVLELSVYAFAVDPDYDDGRWTKRVAQWLFHQPFQWQTLQPHVVWMTDLALNKRMVITKEMSSGEV